MVIILPTMDKSLYHQTLKSMHDSAVDKDYAYGWAGGVLGNPAREEQRITEAYTAGYEDGSNGITDNWKKWVQS